MKSSRFENARFPTRKLPAVLQDQSLREAAVVFRVQHLITYHTWVACLLLLVITKVYIIWLSNVSILNISYKGYFPTRTQR